MIIVDTSIWVDHLRGIASPLDDILGSGAEMLHPFVFGELLLNGLPKHGMFGEKLLSLKPAPVAAPADVAAFIVWAKLAGTGIGYVDTHLLVSARLLPSATIMTNDKGLRAQAARFELAYTPMTTGYSGTPLAKKLSLKDGLTVWFHAMPDGVRAEIGDVGLIEQPSVTPGLDAAHIFVTQRTEMERLLTELRAPIAPNGFVWVSWPKKAAKVPTDITEDTIRAVCLPMGWVDVKVCAVDAVWSGLKLMIRKELR